MEYDPQVHDAGGRSSKGIGDDQGNNFNRTGHPGNNSAGAYTLPMGITLPDLMSRLGEQPGRFFLQAFPKSVQFVVVFWVAFQGQGRNLEYFYMVLILVENRQLV